MIHFEVLGTGMVTAIGHTTAAAYTSMEAVLRRFRETSIRGLDGKPLIASLVLPVTQEITGLRRALALAVPALSECVLAAKAVETLRSALLLSIPQRRPRLPADWATAFGNVEEAWKEELLPAVASEAERLGGVPIKVAQSFVGGHAAGMVAVRRATELLESGEVDQCFVGGVETVGERKVLEVLDMVGAVKSSRVPHGVIPGEAAAFLCLRRGGEASHGGRGPVLFEPVIEDAPEARPGIGTGLTKALGGALTMWGGEPRQVAFLLCDLNGERERAKQMTFATLRTLWRGGALPELIHPADRFGDVGAASAPLLLGLAVHRLGIEESAQVGIVVCSNPNGAHGAAVVTRTRA